MRKLKINAILIVKNLVISQQIYIWKISKNYTKTDFLSCKYLMFSIKCIHHFNPYYLEIFAISQISYLLKIIFSIYFIPIYVMIMVISSIINLEIFSMTTIFLIFDIYFLNINISNNVYNSLLNDNSLI